MNTTVIPTIDFAPFRGGDAPARHAVAEAIGAAAEEYGFMSLTGHGVPAAAIDGAFAAAKAFFALPEAEKLRVRDQQNNRGYIPMFDSQVPGQRPSGHEAFSMGHPAIPADPALAALPFHSVTPFPELAGFRQRLEACYAGMFALSQDVLRAIAIHLGAREDFFAEASRDTYSNMRVIHYPPQEAVADVADFGVRAHFDEGLITLLIQDMNGGLAVHAPGGDWLPVVPNPSAIVVNIGKLLRHWTNGRYNAALHQVINRSGNERYSIPLFVHPSFRTVIDPQALVGEAPSRPEFAPIVAGDRVYANFAKRRPSWKLAEAPIAAAAEADSAY